MSIPIVRLVDATKTYRRHGPSPPFPDRQQHPTEPAPAPRSTTTKGRRSATTNAPALPDLIPQRRHQRVTRPASENNRARGRGEGEHQGRGSLLDDVKVGVIDPPGRRLCVEVPGTIDTDAAAPAVEVVKQVGAG